MPLGQVLWIKINKTLVIALFIEQGVNQREFLLLSSTPQQNFPP
jgi:hypothetical protein